MRAEPAHFQSVDIEDDESEDEVEHVKHTSSSHNCHIQICEAYNDLTIGWQNLNLLSHPNATLAPQARQARASGENFNYMRQVTQARPIGEILNYSLSHLSDMLK